jgi:hypothetical protein
MYQCVRQAKGAIDGNLAPSHHGPSARGHGREGSGAEARARVAVERLRTRVAGGSGSAQVPTEDSNHSPKLVKATITASIQY